MSDDDEYLPPKKALARKPVSGWLVFFIFLCLGAGGLGLWYWLNQPRDRRSEVTEDLRTRAIEGRDIDFAMPQFDVCPNRQEIAKELAADNDHFVRAMAARLLVRGEREPKPPRQSGGKVPFDRHDTPGSGMMVPELAALIKDPDGMVRCAAIRAVNSVEQTEFYRDQLLHALWFGPLEERLLVAEGLGHWNGTECRNVFLSREQPTQVRVAAFRSGEKWRSRQFMGIRFDQSVMQALSDPDAEVRMLGIEASRWVPAVDAASVWLHAATGRYPDTARHAVEVWVSELVETEDADGLSGVRIAMTRNLLRTISGRTGPSPPEVFALAGYVLCRAAVLQAAKLRIPNDRPEWRVKCIALPLIQIPLELANRYSGQAPRKFTSWLPHETSVGDPPTRDLAVYLMGQLRGPAAWIERERDRYLPVEIEMGVFRAGEPTTIGTYADFYRIGTVADVEKTVRTATGKP